MLFNSISFLFLFLPITYLVFWQLKSKNHRYIWLTLTGYFFYGAWNYKFCALMAFSTLVSYLAGLAMLKWDQNPAKRKLCLIIPIIVDLSLLGFFKYTNFSFDTLRTLADLFGLKWSFPVLDIVLPIGISFYTFHTITYIVDSYRRTIFPTRNIFEFSCYVSLFSQLVAGPIVRFRQIEADLEQLDLADRSSTLNIGWSFFIIGMVEKVIIADTIAAIINPALANYSSLSTMSAWLCIVGYSYQLFFDFAGYSNMAVGLGYLFGIRIPQNFNSPYKALNPSDFWHRWHMSLSTCLRDYLYIPLGGSRGSNLNVYRNLMITMLLGGLWHGASWTFVVWGAYHGLLLVLYKMYGHIWDNLPKLIRLVATFVLVMIGWVFFRSESFSMAASLLHTSFVWQGGAAIKGLYLLIPMLFVAAVLAHKAPNTFEISHNWRPGMTAALTVLFVICLLFITGGQQSPFLYFQF